MRFAALAVILLSSPSLILSQVVSRDMVDPDSCPWKQGEWVSARGSFSAISARAPEAPAAGKSLRIQVTYPARAFAYWDALPIEGALPGAPQRIAGWVRSDKAINALSFRFANTNGVSELEINGRKQKLEIGVKEQKPGQWVRLDAKIPDNWPRPLKFAGVVVNNWGRRNESAPESSVIDLCDLRVFTDVTEVPLAERPVLAVVQFPAHGNIFYADEAAPEASLVVGSWRGDALSLEAAAKVVSADGAEKPIAITGFSCLDFSKQTFKLPFAQPGAYKVQVTLKGLGEPRSFTHRYVVILRPPKLTEEQKTWSPYAINIHSGTTVDYKRLSRLGFVWVRDYAFNYGWMVRARGEGNYGGWPWYPKIVESVKNEELKLLPCLMGALQEDPKEEKPSKEWRRNLANIIASFPGQTCWELDNEFQLKGTGYEEGMRSSRYGCRHQVFGQISKAIAPDNWVVEQGAASIPIEAARAHIEAGRYADVDVLNGHRYCGLQAPEICKNNANTGQSDASTSLLRDTYLEWDQVAHMDGKNRQTWITEWGWDTKAGQPVSEWEQAAYIQRGYMLGFACGVDKMFWYWYDDSPEAVNFFDGCGIFDHKPKLEPKPVAAAFAALRSLLPEGMKYVGYAKLSPNAMAQIFESNGKLVAAAFLIDLEKKEGLTIKPPACEAVYDMFGAKVAAGPRELNIAPTWYVGIDKACDWLRQAPMEVTSKHYVRSVSGEPIHIAVTQVGEYSVETPKGWTSVKTDQGLTVTIPEGTPRGSGVMVVTGINQGVKKLMPIDVDIIPEAFIKTASVGFDGTFKVTVNNQSAAHKKHILRPELPDGWQIDPPEAVSELDAGKSTELTFKLAKSTTLRADDKGVTPKIIVYNAQGLALEKAPIVPREWKLSAVKGLKLDGDLKDWPVSAKLPNWMIGPRGELETADIRFGYAPEGLYIGIEMHNSKALVADPRAFWRAADCLELMIGPVAHFKEGSEWAKTDRQFWLCPLVDEHRVFLGNWSRHPDFKTGTDIKVQSFAKRIEAGYAMEILIPAAELGEWNPKNGDEMALSFTLAVQGLRDLREAFWPASKLDSVQAHPWMWGRILLD